jgi:protein TonB
LLPLKYPAPPLFPCPAVPVPPGELPKDEPGKIASGCPPPPEPPLFPAPPPPAIAVKEPQDEFVPLLPPYAPVPPPPITTVVLPTGIVTPD